MTDWSVGDLAVCVDASRRGSPYTSSLTEGAVYTVIGVDTDPGLLDTSPFGLLFAEIKPVGHYSAFASDRFRKIRPDEQSGELSDWELLMDAHTRKVSA